MALCGVIELRKTETVLGELIKIGRLDLGTVATKICEAQIVGHDEDDVGAVIGGRRMGVQNKAANNGEGEEWEGAHDEQRRTMPN